MSCVNVNACISFWSLQRNLENSQFKVKDVVWLDVQLVRNGLHEQRVVLAGEGGGYRVVCSFTVFDLVFGFRVGRRGVELLVDQSKDRLSFNRSEIWTRRIMSRRKARIYLEFSLFVELERVVDRAVKMNRYMMISKSPRCSKRRVTHPKSESAKWDARCGSTW
jgi:hypothetical protein